MDKKVRDLIEKLDWKRISLQLVEYALYKARRLYWKSGYMDLPQGKTPEDIAHEAIEKILSGERNWDPEKNPDILSSLKSVVDSLISHLVRSPNHKRLQPLPEDENGNIREDLIQEWNPNISLNPEEQVLAKEREERMVGLMFELADRDPNLKTIVGARIEGYTKAKEIAESKNMDINNVYNLIKKFKRRSRELNMDDL